MSHEAIKLIVKAKITKKMLKINLNIIILQTDKSNKTLYVEESLYNEKRELINDENMYRRTYI